MNVREFINSNFGVSGIIGIKDVDSLADMNIITLKDGVKDKKIKNYLDWELVAIYPTLVKFDQENKAKEVLLFLKKKKYKDEAEIEFRPIIVLAVCHHVVGESAIEDEETDEDDAELPKNYK